MRQLTGPKPASPSLDGTDKVSWKQWTPIRRWWMDSITSFHLGFFNFFSMPLSGSCVYPDLFVDLENDERLSCPPFLSHPTPPHLTPGQTAFDGHETQSKVLELIQSWSFSLYNKTFLSMCPPVLFCFVLTWKTCQCCPSHILGFEASWSAWCTLHLGGSLLARKKAKDGRLRS